MMLRPPTGFPGTNQCSSPLKGWWSPERFSEDSQEPMSQVGMGVTYTRGSLRQPLREQPTQEKRQELLERYYIPHHQNLTEAVEESLFANDHCLIIDGHSFPALPLPYKLNQTAFRPDFLLRNR